VQKERLVQERAVRVVLDDGDGDDSALAGIAAGLVAGPALSRDALRDFAARFEARGRWEHAAQAYAGARARNPFLCAALVAVLRPADH
jgi:hypothetical protein